VPALALDQGRILPTEDNDFGDLVVRFKLATHGVVRVELKLLDKALQAVKPLAASRISAVISGMLLQRSSRAGCDHDRLRAR
jgi:hypothetical protein